MAEEKLEEKTPSKDDPSDSLKKKKKKKTRSSDESLDSPKKKKKKKKKLPSEDAKRSEFPVKKWALRILIVFGVLGGFYMVQKSNEAKAIAKTYMTSLAALNKLQISCTALWSEVGIDKVCDQALAEKAIGKYLKDVKLTVIEGRSHKFRADIQHKKGDKIFRVNKKGDMFLNTNGCLSKLNIMNPDVEQINRMASNCKTPSS